MDVPTVELFTKAQAGDEHALNNLLERNKGLVHKVVRKRHGHCSFLDYDDLVQEGMLGLMKAIKKFDTQRDLKLSTYAVWWIKQAVSRAMMRDGVIYKPHNKQEAIHQYKDLVQHLKKDNLSTDDKAIAKWMEWDLAKVVQIRELSRTSIKSLDVPLGNDDTGDTFKDTIPGDMPDILDKIISEEEIPLLMTALAQLSSRTQLIIKSRFGMDGESQKSLAELGTELNISRERVRQIEGAALNKLKDTIHHMREEKMSKKIAICLDCGREKTIMGRGLCSRCYQRHRDAGTLDQWESARKTTPPAPTQTNEQTGVHPTPASKEKDPLLKLNCNTPHKRQIYDGVILSATEDFRTPENQALALIDTALKDREQHRKGSKQ